MKRVRPIVTVRSSVAGRIGSQSHMPDCPERDLIIGIFVQAVTDCLLGTPEVMRNARLWLLRDVYGFVRRCDTLCIDPSWMRKFLGPFAATEPASILKAAADAQDGREYHERASLVVALNEQLIWPAVPRRLLEKDYDTEEDEEALCS